MQTVNNYTQEAPIMKTKEELMAQAKLTKLAFEDIKATVKAEDDAFLKALLNLPDHPFTNITSEMFDTYLNKNADYGNSFDQSLDEDGLIAAKVRIGDKYRRFGSLIHNDPRVLGESIEDTLLDMANYAIMTVMWMRGEIKKENADIMTKYTDGTVCFKCDLTINMCKCK